MRNAQVGSLEYSQDYHRLTVDEKGEYHPQWGGYPLPSKGRLFAFRPPVRAFPSQFPLYQCSMCYGLEVAQKSLPATTFHKDIPMPRVRVQSLYRPYGGFEYWYERPTELA